MSGSLDTDGEAAMVSGGGEFGCEESGVSAECALTCRRFTLGGRHENSRYREWYWGPAWSITF